MTQTAKRIWRGTDASVPDQGQNRIRVCVGVWCTSYHKKNNTIHPPQSISTIPAATDPKHQTKGTSPAPATNTQAINIHPLKSLLKINVTGYTRPFQPLSYMDLSPAN